MTTARIAWVLLLGYLAALGIAVAVSHGALTSQRALASAYDDVGGPLACGGTLTWRAHIVANKTMRCGRRLTICSRGRCTHAVVRDRGPYSGTRQFDLAPGTYRALGYPSARAFGVRSIKWRGR